MLDPYDPYSFLAGLGIVFVLTMGLSTFAMFLYWAIKKMGEYDAV